LLKAGVNVNETVKRPETAFRRLGRVGLTSGMSPLILAAANAHFELASDLLDAGADPNCIEPGYTALHVITNVRKPGGGDNDPPTTGSGNMSSLQLVEKLVKKGADINAKMTRKVNFGLTALNTLGATPFFLAAKTSDAELLRLLAKLGADPLLTNADNSTPSM